MRSRTRHCRPIIDHGAAQKILKGDDCTVHTSMMNGDIIVVDLDRRPQHLPPLRIACMFRSNSPHRAINFPRSCHIIH